MRIALYQPEIAGNVGAILRLAACFGVGVDVIEPCGFVFSDARLKRAGMDYIEHVDLVRHSDWNDFRAQHRGRLMLLTTHGTVALHQTEFRPDDILLFGNEGSGVPPEVAAIADARIRIAIRPEARSFNLSVACGIAVAEALRQTGDLPR
ncbi:tRNA (cytidine(34)-2'-O)-methyltransferase [Sphingomonas sp.]|uniref:tRNA (cytidine(34)-2'-O)-methyltransferase n=1 Tax=Sphingomonas sp. TaxID=28214 RepID=UPI0025F46AF4|nr:tRNA (cytidine(34)-2'-O)-methyltransferase [Sphingomonas sp.]